VHRRSRKHHQRARLGSDPVGGTVGERAGRLSTPLAFATAITLLACGPRSGEVTVTGCVAKGVEAGCWTLTAEDGKSYSFNGAGVRENQCVQVTGSEAAGFCMQGTQLDVRKIAPGDRECCPKK